MTEYLQVITTTDSRASAERIATELVQRRLAGCVQIVGPIWSAYRWKGAVESAEEWQCVAKTRGDLYGKVEQEIRSLHPYEEPEILATAISQGSESYLRWLQSELLPPAWAEG